MGCRLDVNYCWGHQGTSSQLLAAVARRSHHTGALHRYKPGLPRSCLVPNWLQPIKIYIFLLNFGGLTRHYERIFKIN